MSRPPSVKIDGQLQSNLREFHDREDIPEHWLNTPIEDFIMSQNFQWPVTVTGKPEVLISTCIEFRYALPVPRGYAYVIRRASGRVLGSEFSVGYVLSKGVRYLLLIGHNDCGMAKVPQAAPEVIDAFVEQGWSRTMAEEYVRKQGSLHAINNELEALREEYKRLRMVFPKLITAPLFICLYDSKLYLPRWYDELYKEERYNFNSGTVPDELIRKLP